MDDFRVFIDPMTGDLSASPGPRRRWTGMVIAVVALLAALGAALVALGQA